MILKSEYTQRLTGTCPNYTTQREITQMQKEGGDTVKNATIYERKWMREARLKAGLTQTDVAEASGTSTANYNRIELGYVEPGIKVGLKICSKLGLSPSNFLNERYLTFG